MAASRDNNAILALRGVPFFAALPDEDVEHLAKKLVPRRYAAGTAIFHLGDPVDHGQEESQISQPDVRA